MVLEREGDTMVGIIDRRHSISSVAASRMPKSILRAMNLNKTYVSRGKTVHAVIDLTLNIMSGEVLAFLGPNGSGKTTSIKMFAGLIKPDSGSVIIRGKDPQQESSALSLVGAVLEGSRNLYWRLTPLENLEYFGVLHGLNRAGARRRANELLKRFGLYDKKDALVQQLSRGMQQKVAISMSLIHDPTLLLLDEPTIGLDVEAAIEVKELIREIATEGKSILLTTHQLEVAQDLSDRVAIMHNGHLVLDDAIREMLPRFSKESYLIELVDEVPNHLFERLRVSGAEVEEKTITFIGEPCNLYKIIATLNPLPILRIEKDTADLTKVFLEVVKGDRIDRA